MRRLRFIVLVGVLAAFPAVSMTSRAYAHTGANCSALAPGSWDKTFKVSAEGPLPWTILQHDEVEPVTKSVVVTALMYQLEGYSPSIPGPSLEMTEGDQVCVEFTNNIDEHTSVHFHGIKAPYLANDTDGVPPVGAGVDIPNGGGKVAVHFTAPPAGAYMYHAHENTTRQILLGLYGRIIVKAKNHRDNGYAYDDTWMLSEWRVNKDSSNNVIGSESSGLDVDNLPNYFIINGHAFDPNDIPNPGNKLVVLKQGQKARIRLIGMGQWAHPMHMHGRNFRVTAQDGVPIPVGQQRVMNTLTVHPGEIWEIEFTAGTTHEDLGIWVFHCHVLDHATNNDHYPGGLVSAIVIQP